MLKLLSCTVTTGNIALYYFEYLLDFCFFYLRTRSIIFTTLCSFPSTVWLLGEIQTCLSLKGQKRHVTSCCGVIGLEWFFIAICATLHVFSIWLIKKRSLSVPFAFLSFIFKKLHFSNSIYHGIGQVTNHRDEGCPFLEYASANRPFSLPLQGILEVLKKCLFSILPSQIV